jgi:uncharacterized protein with beta-barrel porin domain
MPWTRLLSLLSSSSLAALMIGGSGNPASAACVNVGSGSFDNPALSTISCIDASNLHITGNITNEGTLNQNVPVPGILLRSTALTGNIANSGTIDAFIQLTNNSTLTGNIINSGAMGGIQVAGQGQFTGAASTLSGDIFNSSTGVISENGPLATIFLAGNFSGVINNAGLITGPTGAPVQSPFLGAIISVGHFSGSIINTGTISSSDPNSETIVFLGNSTGVSIFNSGTISAASGGAVVFSNGGGNTLTLAPTSLIIGLVQATNTDTLQLGGAGNGTFDLSSIGTFAGGQQYQGFTTFNVIGGSWTVNNTYAQSDPWTVQNGTLLVNGDLSSASNLTVTSGLLGGTGTVGSTQINSGGAFAPGTPGVPGTSMTVSGNLALQSGAIYLVQVNPASSTMANVTQTATLAGNVVAVFAPGSYVNNQYDILHSAGLNGTTFTALGTTNLPAGFTASLSYTPTDVFLNLTAGLGQIGGLSGNQQNIANGLNNFFNGGGTLPPNFLTIFGLSGGNLTAALSQLSGEAAPDSQQGAFQLMNQFLGLMVDPFANGRGGASGGAAGFAPEQTSSLPPDIALAYASVLKAPRANATAPTDRRWNVWGQAYGGYNTANGNPALGTTNMTAHAYGLASGVDYRVTPDTLVGLALAGGGTNWSLAQALGTGRSDAFQAGIYGKTQSGPTYLSASLALAGYGMTTNRIAVGDQLTAKFSAQGYGGRLEGGYRYGMASFGVTPYAALQTQWFHTPDYRETDLTGGGFGLAYNAMTANDTRSELGARFDHLQLVNGMPVLLRARVAWAHDWVSNPSLTAAFQILPGTSFIVNGAAVPSDSALIAAGAALQLNKNLSLEAKFDGQFADTSQIYTGTGTVRYAW